MMRIVVKRPALGDDFWAWASTQIDPITAALQSDAVDQTVGGGTSTSVADFVSTGGSCKPRNIPALNAVRELQRQLNRVADVKGFGLVSVDGSIGPATLALFRRVQAASAGSVMGDASSCITVAADSDVIAAQVKNLADAMGADEHVADPITLNVATVVTKSGKTLAAPDQGILGALAMLSPFEKAALAATAGGIAYLLFTLPAKGRR